MSKNIPYRKASGESVSPSGRSVRIPRWALICGVFAGTIGVCAGVSGDQKQAVFETSLYALLVVPLLLTAAMTGLALTQPFARRRLFTGNPWPDLYRLLLSTALGLGTFALATLLLGTLHLLNPPWLIFLIPALGAAAGLLPTRAFLRKFDLSPLRKPIQNAEWLLLLAAIPIAMLLTSATFPPGTLWKTEGRAYDVLQYHLQLPREYALTNSVAPVSHNVYSSLPANVEMLYLLLTQTAKFAFDPSAGPSASHLWGVFPSQFLHVALMLLAAAATGLTPLPLSGRGRVIAVLTMLAVPWVIITGSLAYNEGGMLLFGTLALGLALKPQVNSTEAVMAGILLGLAVGCKMTAGLFFALPVAALLLWRKNPKALAITTLIAITIYAPWMIRTALSNGGNPLFPIATTALGRGTWTPEQSASFDKGHAAPANQQSLPARAAALITESMLHPQWSPALAQIDEWKGNPQSQAWWAHIGLLWWIVPLAIVLACVATREAWKLLLILALQAIAWMFATQLQSRFLLPIVIPLALLLGLASQITIADGLLIKALKWLICGVIAVQAICTMFLLLPEIGLFGGERFMDNGVPRELPIGELFSRQWNVAASVETADNTGKNPIHGKILLEGNSAPLFFDGDIIYNTVFDKNLLAGAFRAGGPKAAAAWLKDQHFNYVFIDWNEIKRLRATYGFDDAITPPAIEDLESFGIEPVADQLPDNTTLLRVKPVGNGP